MDRNYWQEYWENYYKFMALYLREVQDVYPDVDIKQEYAEVASLFEPSMPFEDYEDYYEYDEYGYLKEDRDPPSLPGGISIYPFILPGGGQPNFPFMPSPNQPPPPPQQPNQPPPPPPGEGPTNVPFISPGGGQFTINNCRRMAIVRVEMKRGFNPNNFYMIVDKADRRSIQGFRIACESSRIRFVPMAVEYRNINLIECVF